VSRSWVDAILAAGVVPASYVPEASVGRTDLEEFTGADPVEDPELRVHSLDGVRALAAAAVGFLDGIEQWRVVGYAGVTPIVRAYVAAAIRLRGTDRRPRTIAEDADELAITRLDRLPDAVRGALERTGVRVVEISADDAGQPARALPAARIEVQKARAALERRLAERRLARLGSDEWLVVDGVLSDSAALSAHPRVVGVVKSHGAEYFAARRPPHQRVPAQEPRRAPRHLLLVSPAVALGGERPAVRAAARGGARASGDRRPSIRDLGLAHRRTRAACDARPALGSVTLPYP